MGNYVLMAGWRAFYFRQAYLFILPRGPKIRYWVAMADSLC
jgi:hypothetical protein